MESPDLPESWSESRVSLIYKAGDNPLRENFRMISLTSCVSKLYHQILADRSVDFLTKNGYIDSKVQKPFINGINGCVEHNTILHEIIADSKSKKRTAHVTFFDLADAFGSVSHELIKASLRRFHMPQNVLLYINNLYSRLASLVTGDGWSSEKFTFKKGVFQGDPFSPSIFLACFNPILEYLESIKERHGYNLNGTYIFTTPYPDDFNLITTNKLQHQKIINNLTKYSTSMGLTLKPTKCRSLAICAGSPKEIDFKIDDSVIQSVKQSPQRFLG